MQSEHEDNQTRIAAFDNNLQGCKISVLCSRQQRTTGTVIRYLKLHYLQTQTDTSKSFIASSNGLAVINHYKEAIEDRLWDGFQWQPATLLA